MNRRGSLAAIANAIVDGAGPGANDRTANSPANKTLPKVDRTTAGLELYTGTWDTPQIMHLLRRTMFGATQAHIAQLKQMSVSSAVDLLLTPPPEETSQPLVVDSRDLAPVGETWVYQLYKSADPTVTFNPTGIRTNSLKSWWLGLMLNQQLSIREKMVLFWQNHFVTEISVVNDPRFSYRYLALLRSNALGNFQNLAKSITFDGAMLRYLNGNTNRNGSPNENYARELQELFTIGKGPEIAPGDYTNYTEADVKAAARVLTGWRDDATQLTIPIGTPWLFDPTRHDTSNKQFSNHYGNTVITGRSGPAGMNELDDLLKMIFSQQETAKFICRKLYRYFVYYVIDADTEANIIAPLASTLQSNNYEILPVLNMLLKSAHFFDPLNMGCVIKSPIEHIVGLCRQFGVVFPTDVAKQYALYVYLWNQAASMQQNIGEQPNVAGWPAYYQTPEFYELWINSDTLPKRTRLTDLLGKSGYTTSGATIVIDPIAFAKTLSNPADPNVLISESAQYLFAVQLTAGQIAFLKGVLLPGNLPDYEWTNNEWGAYIADPTNTTKISTVKSRLQALYTFMMEMPEFQLT